YVHIPFCAAKCAYCDFLSAPADEETRAAYVKALAREIACDAREDLAQTQDLCVVSVYFGGGTPTCLAPEQLAFLLDEVRRAYPLADDCEITLEANPGTVNEKGLRLLRSAGFNRISLGVQSFIDRELKLLGRIYNVQEAREAICFCRAAGFENMSLDLISALPGQTVEDFALSLREAVLVAPDHISVYSLILEDGTPFAAAAAAEGDRTVLHLPDGTYPLPDEETERAMYRECARILGMHGFERYEISNYARPGRRSRHNSGYWTGRPYRGAGLGAASLLELADGPHRLSVTRDLKEYLRLLGEADEACAEEAPTAFPWIGEDEVLTEGEQQEEFFFLGLRRMEGVLTADYAARFGDDAWEAKRPVVDRLIGQGLLEETDGRLKLTERGIDLANQVFLELM
ncbi:MAG: radical SAM family heme chaperone HemW, partial [Lachnospiraceae bacterium]|nr:radical SAM family heme chaperone HemW [Lachnospiraceae bacterium]